MSVRVMTVDPAYMPTPKATWFWASDAVARTPETAKKHVDVNVWNLNTYS